MDGEGADGLVYYQGVEEWAHQATLISQDPVYGLDPITVLRRSEIAALCSADRDGDRLRAFGKDARGPGF